MPVDVDGKDDDRGNSKDVIDVDGGAEHNEAAKRMSAEAAQEGQVGAKQQITLARSSTS